MKRTPSSYKRILYGGACLLLCVGILLSIFLPAADLIRARLENPLGDTPIQDVTILEGGGQSGENGQIVIPNGGSVKPTEPEETKPEDKPPEETKPDDPEPSDPNQGNDDQGNEDGNQGEDGGDDSELELLGVLTWYKYGTEPNAIACGPSETVAKSINTAQLANNALKYAFSLSGKDAARLDIKSVTLAAGDAAAQEVADNGSITIQLPDGGQRNYTLCVIGEIVETDETGEPVRQEVVFTFVLKCAYALDLDLVLTWRPKGGNQRQLVCGADKTEVFSVKNNQLNERVFSYWMELTGSLADDARIIDAYYTTASGQQSGQLALDKGTLILNPAAGQDNETYFLTFTVKTSQREVTYQFQLNYQETVDVQLQFQWMEKGTTQRILTCNPGNAATLRIKSNQLSAGAIAYSMKLTGADGEQGRLLGAAYTSEAGGSGNLEAEGSLPLSIPEGASSNTYHLTVSAMVSGQRVDFEITIQLYTDISLKLQYTVLENGVWVTRQVICENTRSKTAEAVYDDQLTGGMLSYTMELLGAESGLTIVSVTCYQYGSGKTVTLTAQGAVKLLLKEGKTGENTFRITAQDSQGTPYQFNITIPYKHRGENNIKITTNLVSGQIVPNETNTNLTVKAWSEDASGNVISYIPANGTDTKLIVKLNGAVIGYTSTSGALSEYTLYLPNPDQGDSNTHTLYIYAEDAYGNYGEVTIHLTGQRNEPGQKIGEATIYVDLTVLGLDVVAKLNYDVLADEPISYVIAKAIMGLEMKAPFGAAKENLGWSGRYAGTLDDGFYLQSLTTGLNANALEGSRWPGSTAEEVLKAIDDRFGAGTGLAALWRCLYRNGLNKSSGSGSSFGEFDYTSGSGWIYSIGGATYYPGQSMSSIYLQDGDVLTLRYTLAYGWDVGGGSPGYGSTVGYCVSAVNGKIYVDHQMEQVTNANGTVSNVCRCCGMVEACAHANKQPIDLGDGMHVQYCADCQQNVGDPENHVWAFDETVSTQQHSCVVCGSAETHKMQEISNDATCTQPGIRVDQCRVCYYIREKESGPKGHTWDKHWFVTEQGHYQKCSVCGQFTELQSHQYECISYTENGAVYEDFVCRICDAFHIDECDGEPRQTDATCQRITYCCDSCDHSMKKEGIFDAYHAYADGSCVYCGQPDPQMQSRETPAVGLPASPFRNWRNIYEFQAQTEPAGDRKGRCRQK